MNSDTIVYFISLIKLNTEEDEILELTTPAFYFDEQEAIDCVKYKHKSIHLGNRFNYAIVEGFKKGVAGFTSKLKWFKIEYIDNNYVITEIIPPERYKQISAFAISY